MLQMWVALRLFLRCLMIKWRICRNFVDAASHVGCARELLFLCGRLVIFMRDSPDMRLLPWHKWHNFDMLL